MIGWSKREHQSFKQLQAKPIHKMNPAQPSAHLMSQSEKTEATLTLKPEPGKAKAFNIV